MVLGKSVTCSAKMPQWWSRDDWASERCDEEEHEDDKDEADRRRKRCENASRRPPCPLDWRSSCGAFRLSSRSRGCVAKQEDLWGANGKGITALLPCSTSRTVSHTSSGSDEKEDDWSTTRPMGTSVDAGFQSFPFPGVSFSIDACEEHDVVHDAGTREEEADNGGRRTSTTLNPTSTFPPARDSRTPSSCVVPRCGWAAANILFSTDPTTPVEEEDGEHEAHEAEDGHSHPSRHSEKKFFPLPSFSLLVVGVTVLVLLSPNVASTVSTSTTVCLSLLFSGFSPSPSGVGGEFSWAVLLFRLLMPLGSDASVTVGGKVLFSPFP